MMLRVVLVLTALASAYGEFVPDNTIRNKITADGYYTESHQVTTEDGYILEINRIPYGRFQNESDAYTKRPVVFLMHGILSSAICWILLGPQASIAYNLADAGYDVWMGNARGVANSRHHVILNPDDPHQKMEFFDYSFEEIGVIDVPTMINYALKTTGQKQVHYIGHSQGGTAFLILTSMNPEYNEKFKSVHLLSGVGYQEHTPNKIATTLSTRTNLLYAFALRHGFVELDANLKHLLPFQENEMCPNGDEDTLECDMRSVIGILQRIVGLVELAASAAIKQVAHYGQNIRDKLFRRWDYGSIRNVYQYGRLTPPDYNLSLISADVTMHYSLKDLILAEDDVLAMAASMPNARARKIQNDNFLHTDYLTMPKVKPLVTDHILEHINSFYEHCYYEY